MAFRDEPHAFIPLWSKYRPVIIKLMASTTEGPQDYQLYNHEFKALSKKDKNVFTFTLEAHNGRAVNNIKTSQVAIDLLAVLQQSKTALQLLSENTFEFSMDRNFVFHINRKG